MGEVVVHHLWDALLIEASKSPNVSLFKRFRDVFPQLSYSRESLNIPETPPELLSKKEEVITVCKNFLEKQDSYRRTTRGWPLVPCSTQMTPNQGFL